MQFEPAVIGGENKYLYNGKEMQEDAVGGVGLDWYDYEARFYNPALGRFHTIDPISPFFPEISPYNYANDNPIYFRDEYGLGIGDFLNKLKDFALTTIGFTRHGTVVAKNNYYT